MFRWELIINLESTRPVTRKNFWQHPLAKKTPNSPSAMLKSHFLMLFVLRKWITYIYKKNLGYYDLNNFLMSLRTTIPEGWGIEMTNRIATTWLCTWVAIQVWSDFGKPWHHSYLFPSNAPLTYLPTPKLPEAINANQDLAVLLERWNVSFWRRLLEVSLPCHKVKIFLHASSANCESYPLVFLLASHVLYKSLLGAFSVSF